MWMEKTLRPVSSFAEKTVRPKPPFMEKPWTQSWVSLSAEPPSSFPRHVSWGSQCVGKSPGLGLPFPQAPGPASLPGGRGTGPLFPWLASQIRYSYLPLLLSSSSKTGHGLPQAHE